MKNRWTKTLILAVPSLAMCWGSGCATPNDQTPLTEKQVLKILERAQDPRRYSLTVYRSDSGPVYAGANRLHPGQHEDLPFKMGWKDNAPIIKFSNRFKKYHFDAMVDTTSRHSWIDLRTYSDLAATPLAPPAVPVPSTSVQSDAPGFLCTADKVILNELHIETPLFWFRATLDQKLGPLTRGEDPERVQAIMGCDMLKAFKYASFDFAGKTLSLDTSRAYQPEKTRLIQSLPYTMDGGQLGVEGAIEGRPTTFLLDTAGDFALALPDPLPEKVTLVSLGDMVYQNPELVSTGALELGNPQIPRIGRGLLDQYRITLDNKAKVVHFEKPAPRPLVKLPSILQ